MQPASVTGNILGSYPRTAVSSKSEVEILLQLDDQVALLREGEISNRSGTIAAARWIGGLLHRYLEAVGSNSLFDLSFQEKTAFLFRLLQRYDPETATHTQRVAALAEELGSFLRLRPGSIELLRSGALLHDIGKLCISAKILNGAGALTPQQWEIIKLHPRTGFLMLNAIPGLEAVARIVLNHHERFNGSGYPAAAAGNTIPYFAQIVAICDVVDALQNKRSYKAAWSDRQVENYLDGEAQLLFAPDLCRQMREMLKQRLTSRFALVPAPVPASEPRPHLPM
ncbi:MAG: HD domain-containing protein [Oligoflexia bacterium]|nr:HD domain-containing protein [Oligoflexia bacterium]